MEKNKNTISELMSRGRDLDEMGDHKSALQTYDKVISMDGRFFDGWVNKGIQQFKLNKLSSAVEAFEMALTLNPNDPLTRDLLKQLDNLLNSPVGSRV